MSAAIQHDAISHWFESWAPLRLAGDWDNVGWIVEPSKRHTVSSVLLCIDLNEAVWREAQNKHVELIVSYHPPIFSGLKRLRASIASQRVVLEALQQGVAIYSPHSALDAARGGMTDWLAACVYGDSAAAASQFSIDVLLPAAGGRPEAKDAEPLLGAGRLVCSAQAMDLQTVVSKLKKHLGLARLRVAAPTEKAMDEAWIRRIAFCPGAGGGLFSEAKTSADVFVTGEMRHHDVLARVRQGAAVILSEHSHTERGYLPVLADKLRAAFTGLTVHVSTEDSDPLTWM